MFSLSLALIVMKMSGYGLSVLSDFSFLGRLVFYRSIGERMQFFLEMFFNFVLGVSCFDEIKPSFGWFFVFLNENFDNVAVLQGSIERDYFSVYFGAGALLADFRVNMVSEVNRRRVLRQVNDVAFRGQDENPVFEKIYFQRFKKLFGSADFGLPFPQLLDPAEFFFVKPRSFVRFAGFGVGPVRGNAVLGDFMHLFRPYLKFGDFVVQTKNGCVNALITVGFGQGDVVLDFVRQRTPEFMNDSERAIALVNV